jgi:serine kinase of HPr protein (carbohydrate metabolism regulator)
MYVFISKMIDDSTLCIPSKSDITNDNGLLTIVDRSVSQILISKLRRMSVSSVLQRRLEGDVSSLSTAHNTLV